MNISTSIPTFTRPELRTPKGIGVSPYPFLRIIRYLFNSLTNGYFSSKDPDYDQMNFLKKEGKVTFIERSSHSSSERPLKILFLGDIMVSFSGAPPILSDELKNQLKSADIIVANTEAPVIDSSDIKKRGFSLNFAMNNTFLKSIAEVNKKAQWIFSIANNHACDNSMASSSDISGIKNTIRSIKQVIPQAIVIGAEVEGAYPVYTHHVENGPAIDFVAWTGVMNHDHLHYKKPIIRAEDLVQENLDALEGDYRIGFVHDNEEQRYTPLSEVKNHWRQLIENRSFDLIIGHGPHVLQAAEQYRNGIIFHSIGNFCSPKGGTQTKVGAIPEINLQPYDKKIESLAYKVHIIEQSNESIDINSDLNGNNQRYPSIIQRLHSTIWRTLFINE